MRSVILLALCAHAVCYGQESLTTKTAKIEEIFRLSKVDQMQKQMMTQMSAMMKQQTMAGLSAEERQAATDAGQRIIEFTMKKMSWEAMKPEFIKLYNETYTEDEISGILLFYQSAPGQAMLAKSPVLMSNTMALVQKRMAEIKPELDELMKKNLTK